MERVLVSWHPFPKLDGKSIEHGLPVLHRHRPPFGNVVQRQIEQFEQRLIAGERSSILRNLAQTHVYRFDGVGRVNDAPDLRRVIEERRDAIPVPAPRLHDRRVLCSPLTLAFI